MAELILNGETKSITAEELQSQSITKIIMSNNATLSITTKLRANIEVDITDSDIRLTCDPSIYAYGLEGSIKDSIIRTLSNDIQFPAHNTLIIDNCQFYNKKSANITTDENYYKIIGAQSKGKLILKNLHDVWLQSSYYNYGAGLLELENCSRLCLTGCRARVTDDFLNQLARSSYVYLMPTLLDDGEYGYSPLEISKARSAVGIKLANIFYTSLTETNQGYVSDRKYPSNELITEEWLQYYTEQLILNMPNKIHHDGGRVFKISGSLACIPVQCFIQDNDNFLDVHAIHSSEPRCNYPISPWRNGDFRRCAMSTKTTKLKLQLAPNYQCKVSKIIDMDFNSSTEIFRSGNLFKFIEIEGYMGDSINSLSIVPIPTAFVDGSIKVVTGDTKYIDGDIVVQCPYFIELDGSILIQAVAREDIDGTIICAVNAEHTINGDITVKQASESTVNDSIDIKAIQIYDLNGDLGCAQPVTDDISFEGSLIVSGLIKVMTGEVNVQPTVSVELAGTLIINQETLDLDGALTVIAPAYKDIDGAITLNIARAEMDCWFEILDEGGGWI